MKKFLFIILTVILLVCSTNCALNKSRRLEVEIEGEAIVYIGNFDYSKYTVVEKTADGKIVKKYSLTKEMIDRKSELSLY